VAWWPVEREPGSDIKGKTHSFHPARIVHEHRLDFSPVMQAICISRLSQIFLKLERPWRLSGEQSQLTIASEREGKKHRPGEGNDGTFAAQPRTFAATSGLPISTEGLTNQQKPSGQMGRMKKVQMTAVIKPRGGPFSQRLTRQARAGFASQLEDMDEG
jgi:hypothetical protein